MSYAETQQETIRAQLRGRSPAIAPPPAEPPARVRPLRATTPAPRPVPPVRAAATPPAARAVVLPTVAGDADADLAAAVAAAGRLRFMADIEQIASAAGVTVDQVRGSSRTHELVEVRRIIAAYLRRRGCSLPEIGRLLDRDHTSVMNLLRVPAKAAGLYEEVAS